MRFLNNKNMNQTSVSLPSTRCSPSTRDCRQDTIQWIDWGCYWLQVAAGWDALFDLIKRTSARMQVFKTIKFIFIHLEAVNNTIIDTCSPVRPGQAAYQ